VTEADGSLLRLLQISSPSLPVGSYAYSQGLEYAVEAGWVDDEASLSGWIGEQIEHAFGRVDLPVFHRMYVAATHDDEAGLRRWARRLVAMRETSELLADDCDRGRALVRLLVDLEVTCARPWLASRRTPFAVPFALAAVSWRIPLAAAMQALVWSWLESQVLAGVKLIPLGQVAGQRLLLGLAQVASGVVARAVETPDDEIGSTLHSVAIASSLHETQYSRLFRS